MLCTIRAIHTPHACDNKPHVFTIETRENNLFQRVGIVVILTDYKITPVIYTRISDSVCRVIGNRFIL